MSIKLKIKQYLILILSTPLLIAITPESAPAFTIKQPTQITNDFFDISEFKNGKGKVTGIGVTTLGSSDPIIPWSQKDFSPFLYRIQLGGTPGLLQDLKPYTKLGWTFTKGPDLRGSFDVGSYYACGTKKRCGLNPIQSGTGGVGAVLKLNYSPAQRGKKGKIADPKPQDNLLYWIQRVITNNPPPEKRARKQRTYIDNRIEIKKGQWQNAIHPYYTYNARKLQNNGYFGDRPYRKANTSLKSNFYWMAELYLAEADPINQQQVTIYNGVRWGWRYQYYSIDELRKKNPLSCPIVNNNKGKITKVSNNKEQQFWASLVETGALSTSLINTICQTEPPKPKPPKPPEQPCSGGSGGGGCSTDPPCSGGSGGGGCRSRRSQPATTDYVEILDQIESQELSESGDRHDTSTPTKQKNPRTHFSVCSIDVRSRSDR